MNAAAFTDAPEIEPLRLVVPHAAVARLRQSLSHRARIGEALAASAAYGAAWSTLRELLRHFEDGFELERQALFELPCFEARLASERVCFVHARSRDDAALPLLLLHGAGASLAEFQDQIRPLTQGTAGRSFHVVCPSLPGFGLTSGDPSPRAAARACAALMARLGYARYLVHGSELGAKVALELAAIDGGHTAALHVTTAPAYPTSVTELADLSSGEKSRLTRLFELHNELHDGSPETPLEQLAFGLSRVDDELVASRSVRDGLLTALALSCALGSSAGRALANGFSLEPAPSSSVPIALEAFPLGAPSLRRFAQQRYRVAEWREHELGGGMPALEQPELFRESLTRWAAQLA
jgi:epoxide hydrolase